MATPVANHTMPPLLNTMLSVDASRGGRQRRRADRDEPRPSLHGKEDNACGTGISILFVRPGTVGELDDARDNPSVIHASNGEERHSRYDQLSG